MRKIYNSDIKDENWDKIKHLIEIKKRGRKEKYSAREKLNALLYILVNGVSYRNLPNDFPPFKSVFQFKKTLEKNNIIDLMLEIAKKKSN